MNLLLAALLVFQAGVRNDIAQLRQFLGASYMGVVDLLNTRNQILLNNTQRLAPAQAARMRAQMQVPPTLPTPPILSARIQNIGQGLLTFLFEDDFIVEQVNFVFCPPDPEKPKPEQLMALQVLFDDRHALGTTLGLLRVVYQMPAPLVLPPDFKPQLMYPLAANPPATFWDLGAAEGVYQPVAGKALISGQLWLTDKNVVMQCANIPMLPNP